VEKYGTRERERAWGAQRYVEWIEWNIYAEVVNFWGRVEAKGLPAIQRGGCPTEK